ncbi:MAG TPA: decaprenyl-phosphate phosphoribosyltransferase [Rhodocyclaceae bacterium]|nr:MAG: prenyltransferase [Betaproteobacteria bacterium CG2_30_68_42]PIX74208.1 MAG: decaprenyl-phosphate phosphoribosyltransferase [Rhodocyclales bacterium CG_4_10_14_3_um_filter_68_10]PJA57612.1 MAG: decaprenyl-phosphate phosphoribosyltransferase [Rhodocyclales bacterium CG_4_9_14_3_um_filter_68_10]HCX34210.1 decaprenyl-phosphate phosphoribosyltransferase [Rhodocyclaceae bacterium]
MRCLRDRPRRPDPTLPALLTVLRPQQWIKNGFVFVGLLFGHAWNDGARVGMAFAAFVAFCLLASAVYAMNDIADREADRLHPRKSQRPVARGAVSVAQAAVLSAACAAAGLALGFGWGGHAPWIFPAYLAINLAYSFGLKHVVILDVFLISAGFMLRILAGTLGLAIAPSHWLLACGLLVTLFLGFAKRRAELDVAGTGAAHRRVLEHYSAPLLDQMITVAAAGTVVAYALYTLSPETIALHGTDRLVFTVPFVLYGMFRYLYLLHRRGGGGDPAVELVRDPHLVVAAAGWLALTAWLLGAAP